MSIKIAREMNQLIQECMLDHLEQEFEWLFWLRVDMGLAYISQVMHYSGKQKEAFQSHPLFWGWWVNEWSQRDEELLLNIKMGDNGLVYEDGTYRIPLNNSLLFQRFYCDHHGQKAYFIYPEAPVLEGLSKRPRVRKSKVKQSINNL